MGNLFAAGATLAEGRYRIDGPLASGGMAQVYRAHDVRLDRPVAIKTMLPALAFDQDAAARFRRESQALAALNHPHVVTVHDTGEEPSQDGPPVPYFVMELVPGPSLEALLRTHGPLPVPEALRLTDQVLYALEASHALGLVHRDIKPANVLLASGGVAKVSDFGIARALTRTALTGTHGVIGTRPYMAPEQLRGAPDLDGRCDLYAVGVLLFELLTDRKLFDGPDIFAVALQQEQPLPDLVSYGVSGGALLDAFLARALAVRPDNRYPDARAMRAALAVAGRAPAMPQRLPTGHAGDLGADAQARTRTAVQQPPRPTVESPSPVAGPAPGTVRPEGGPPLRNGPIHVGRLVTCAVLLAVAFWLGGTVEGYTDVGDWGTAVWRSSGQGLAGLAGALGALPLWSPDRKGPVTAYRVFSWVLLIVHLLVACYAALGVFVLSRQEGCVKDVLDTYCVVQ